ncbi:MAG: hypothetical protein K9G49_05035 [Taibaiella sp.]|nr:hypothetical protein [Taibaiella sp.]
MFDQILQLVKEQMSNSTELTAAIPAQQQEAVNSEIANHVTEKLQAQGAGGMLDMLGGGMDINNITSGLAEKLGTKFGLPQMVTGAIVSALPGLLKQFTGKDSSGGKNGLDALTGGLGSKLGGLFG